MPSRPTKRLDTFANPARDRDYRIHMEIPEFTCLCPMTGQPDFATLVLDYVPDALCVELKSLKLYVCRIATGARSTKRSPIKSWTIWCVRRARGSCGSRRASTCAAEFTRP